MQIAITPPTRTSIWSSPHIRWLFATEKDLPRLIKAMVRSDIGMW